MSFADELLIEQRITRIRRHQHLLLKEVNTQLNQKGQLIKYGSVSIIDASVIEAQRDPYRKMPLTAVQKAQNR